MDREAFRGYALALDENAEGARVDGLQGRGLLFFFFVTGPCRHRGHGGDHNAHDNQADTCPRYSRVLLPYAMVGLHSTSPSWLRCSSVLNPSFAAISSAISSTVRPPVSMVSDASR